MPDGTGVLPAGSGIGLWPLALALAPLTAFFLVLSALLERSGPIRLRHWAEEAGGRLLAVYEDPARFEVFRFLLNLGARLSLLTLLLALVSELGGVSLSLGVVGGFLAVVLLATGIELLNRSLVGSDPEPVLRQLTGAYRAVLWLARPLVRLLAPLVPLRRSDDGGLDGDEEGEVSAEEIEAFIDVGKREGIIEGAEEDLVRSVVDFGDTLVRSVMTPRTEMVCAPVGSTLDELADLFLLSKHSRIPLHEGSIDQVVGLLHIRDLLAGLRSDPRPSAAALAKPAFVVPETKPLSELLKELQSRHVQLAMVVDEHGGIAGLVTIEDLVEQIVGDIIDEHEELPSLYEVLATGGFRLDGRAPVDVLEDLFHLDVADEPSETVGGLVFSALGTVPEIGDAVVVHGLRFVVMAVDQRRVSRVEVSRATDAEVAAEGVE
jgi:CBS domain containing-hemolysin-like protein